MCHGDILRWDSVCVRIVGDLDILKTETISFCEALCYLMERDLTHYIMATDSDEIKIHTEECIMYNPTPGCVLGPCIERENNGKGNS